MGILMSIFASTEDKVKEKEDKRRRDKEIKSTRS